MLKFSTIIPAVIFSSLIGLAFAQTFAQNSALSPEDKDEFFEVYLKDGSTLTVKDIDGLGYIDDMILGRTEDMKRYGLDIAGSENLLDDAESFITPRGIVRYPRSGYLWPDGIIPYQIDSELSPEAREDFEYAVQHWNSKTNLKLIPRSDESDYLEIKAGNECSSWVGRQGGPQALTLASHCGRGLAVHEVGHAAGMFHEHNRINRDRYVTVRWDNITASSAYSFQKIKSNEELESKSYDYYSIMHHRTDAFTSNGLATLQVKDSNVDVSQMGSSDELSHSDIALIASLYGAKYEAVYNGYLVTGSDVDVQPNGDSFKYDGGFLAARLTGPEEADFELELQKWNDSAEVWENVVESTNSGSNESISYQADSGYYQFIVYSYNSESAGRYTFELNQ